VTQRHLILLVEESDSSLGFYDSLDGSETGRITLGLWPHEIAVSNDGRTAYVTNFGLRDYDLTLGYAGNSISVIDIPNRCETHRLYTCDDNFRYWGPHGVKVSPDGQYLFVNVERVVGRRDPDPTAGPGQEQTKMLVFEVATEKIVASFSMPPPSEERPLQLKQQGGMDERFFLYSFPQRKLNSFSSPQPLHLTSHTSEIIYDVPRGSHNFVFSPDGEHLWIFSGRGGISRMNPFTGEITAELKDFNGSVRSLSFTSNRQLLVSATDEISLVDPATLEIVKRIGNLGVGQILYSKATPDARHVLAPAVWEGLILVIDLESEEVTHRIQTGVDPVQVMVAPHGRSAYVTHGRSRWTSEIDFSTFTESRRILTQGGPNGAAFAPWFERPTQGTITFGACLPVSGEHSVEGREMRLGYQYWQDETNASGGIMVDGRACQVEIAFADTESKTDESSITEITEKVIADHQVQFLLGTYRSLPNLYVAKVADHHKIPFVTATGADEVIYNHGFKYVFGIMSPAHRYLSGVISSLWAHLSPKPRTITFLSCDDAASLADAQSTAQFAQQKGLQLIYPDDASLHIEPPGIVVYRHLSTQFEELIKLIREVAPDIFMNTGHRQESIALVRSSHANHFTPGAIALNFGFTIPAFRTLVGAAANGIFGSSQWTDAVSNCGHDRFGTAQDFSRNYFAEFSEKPSYLAAGSAACGVVCEEAIRKAGSSNPQRLRDALSAINLTTFYGQIDFDERGLNTAKPIITVQLRQHGDEIREIPVWPPEVAGTNRPVWPFPGWEQGQ
jgi:ABC-type branched-subunit amino acid transport system substrate-binding protein/DNA-binding beta-propeller fold protein YncE